MLEWVWIAGLFVFALLIGIVAPIAGVGGGVLFVPLAAAFFPFHIDFVRGAGITLALASALSSTPHLIKKGLANIRIMAPVALVVITTAILGSLSGLWVTRAFPKGENYINLALGVLLLFISSIYLTSKRVEFPEVNSTDPISERLGLRGAWFEPSLGRVIEYKTTRFLIALPAFAMVGFIGGMFGLGAGWANVPTLNLIMKAPLKVATATSMSIIALHGSAATSIYLSQGAILPMIAITATSGMTIGARIGAQVMARARPRYVRYFVLGAMLIGAVLDIQKGLAGLI